MLQIYLKEPNKIYIGGLFRTDKGESVSFTPSKTIVNPIEQIEEPKRLFKYPSRENPGKLEVENLPSFDRYDDELALAQQINSNKLSYRELTNEALKRKVEVLVKELTQLHQTYRSQNSRLDDEYRKTTSTEAFKQMRAAIMAAKSPKERGKALQPLIELNERFREKRSQIEQPIVEIYKQQMRLDAILIRDEMLRRVQEVPRRSPSLTALNIFYAGNFGANVMVDIIEDLQVLAANLP